MLISTGPLCRTTRERARAARGCWKPAGGPPIQLPIDDWPRLHVFDDDEGLIAAAIERVLGPLVDKDC